jgi:hypothetical protein
MTDQSQEPTMEEILASIRRIISEDDQPAETAAPAPAPAPEPEPAPAAAIFAAPEPEPAPVFEEVEDDVLDLTDPYETPAVETLGDLDIGAPEEPAPAYDPYVAPTPAPASDYDALVGESAAASAASAFAGLHASLNKPAAPVAAPTDLTFASGSTVEAMVAEMLRPMLKGWLDANLPGIVEEAVRKEVERISRSV